ncbi:MULTISPECIES: MGMT family protein [Aliivibrio]|uniref:MGMT family protein n=1 Tax=Aliivibrio finisterrensis TaxID=511998 RepID=A0A4Q5KYB4_9GAMM|nr:MULTISPECIES: MGMT family protein [Aliivibrio]MDD9180333.1 MGMT family protein [Aliivibrio sp. A6]RYU52926.1 MGMT family protein [Aliivibrio finisterrensis]RYU54651.1 MGMT family protein [Aliivibrio finisterrensis]RYU55240.1 MGMT family protein [Aliivibrio finisterrensis]RYU65324.1 MGMT family protein [Aliivibrio finisterrensis]
MDEFAQNIYTNLYYVPKGRVITYGQLATLAGFPNHSRHVGKVLSQLPKETQLPWYRVVNAQGKISLQGGRFERQKQLLEEENILIKDNGSVSNFKQVVMP